MKLSLLFPIFLTLFSVKAMAWNTPSIPFGGGNKYTKWTWIGGGGDSNWSTAANWCGTYLNGSCLKNTGTAPTSTDNVVFNNICGSSCNVTIDTAVSVRSIAMHPSFTGTISQGSQTLTIGAGGFIQQGGTWLVQAGSFNSGTTTAASSPFTMTGGTFNGGGGSVTIGIVTADAQIKLNGGTYTASSGTTRFFGSATFVGLSSFTHSSGTFEFVMPTSTGATYNFTNTSAIFNNVSFIRQTDVAGASNLMSSTTLVMDGNLTFDVTAGTNSRLYLDNGTINIRSGNATFVGGGQCPGVAILQFTGTGAQNLDISGMTSLQRMPGITLLQPAVTGSFNIIGATGRSSPIFHGGFRTLGNMGTVSLTTITSFEFFGVTTAGTYFDTAGYVTLPSLTLSGDTVGLRMGSIYVSGDVVVSSVTPFDGSGGNTGIVYIGGNLSFTTGRSFGSSAVFEFNGTGNQVIDSSGSTNPVGPTYKVNKPSGSFSFVGNPVSHSGWNYVTSGSITMPSTFTFGSSLNTSSNNVNITTGGIPFNSVSFRIGGSTTRTVTITDSATYPMLVNNDLSLGSTNNSGLLLVGTIEIKGNISSTASVNRGFENTSTGKFLLSGSGQILDFTLSNSTIGSSILLPPIEIASTGGTTTITGVARLGNYTYTSGTVDATGSTLSLSGTSRTAVSGGTSTQFGNLHIRCTTALTLTGIFYSTSLSFSHTNPCALSGAISTSGNLDYSNSGAVTGTATITLTGNNSNISRSGAGSIPTGTITVAKSAGQKVTLTSNVTLTGSLSVSSGQVDIASAAQTLTIPVGQTLTLASGTTVKLSGGTLSVAGTNYTTPQAYSSGNIIN